MLKTRLENLFFPSVPLERFLETISLPDFLARQLNIGNSDLETTWYDFDRRENCRTELERFLRQPDVAAIVYCAGCFKSFRSDTSSREKFPDFFSVEKTEKLRILVELIRARYSLSEIRRFVLLAEAVAWHAPVKLPPRPRGKHRSAAAAGFLVSALIVLLIICLNFFKQNFNPPELSIYQIELILAALSIGTLADLFRKLFKRISYENKLFDYCLKHFSGATGMIITVTHGTVRGADTSIIYKNRRARSSL